MFFIQKKLSEETRGYPSEVLACF